MDTFATIETIAGKWYIILSDGKSIGGRFNNYSAARKAFDRFGFIAR